MKVSNFISNLFNEYESAFHSEYRKDGELYRLYELAEPLPRAELKKIRKRKDVTSCAIQCEYAPEIVRPAFAVKWES